MPTPLPPWLVALLVVAVVAAWGMFWCWLCLTLGRLGGWRRLAAAYPAPVPEPPPRLQPAERVDGNDANHHLINAPTHATTLRFQSLNLRGWAGYNQIVRLEADAHGLHLSMPWFLRLGHAPILLPWTELSASRKRGWFIERVILVTAAEPTISIAISAKLARRLAAARPKDWPKEKLQAANP